MPKTSIDSNTGVFIRDILQCNALFIGGKRFEEYINELVFEDQFEAGEIAELQLLLQYLNTSGLSSEWILDNNNKNQDLKTAITALQTKLANIDTTTLTQSSVLNDANRNSVLKTAIDNLITKLANIDTTALTQSSVLTDANRNSVLKTAIDNLITKLANIDTTALTQSSVLTDDNRNSVLKTRIDGNDGSLSTLNDKTRFITQSVLGSNTANPTTPNSLIVSTNTAEVDKSDLRLVSGLGVIRMTGNKDTEQDINYADNQTFISFPNGMISMNSHLLRMMAADKIEIGEIGITNSAAINIGGKGAQINIGSIDAPDSAPSTNTIITIGLRTQTRNTETYLQGNIYTNESRWEDLPVSTGISLSDIISLLSGSAPSYVLGAFLSNAGGFNYSDILHMNLSNPLQKNGDITTTKGIVIDSLKIFDSSPVSVFPKISTYFVNGDIVSTQVVGDNTTSVFSGQIKLENHNTLNPLNINWALSQDDERVNVIDIKGDDGIFIHQGASSNGRALQIMNSCNGGIELRVGGTNNPDNRGLKSEALGGLFLRRVNQLAASIVNEDPDIIPSFKRKTNNPTAQVDYRLLVSVNNDIPQGILSPDGLQQNHGIVVINEDKHHAIETAALGNLTQPVFTEYTAIDEDNITTPSLTFLGTYAGTTTKTLYTNANDDLMYNGEKVAVGSIAASGGGLTYIISAPSSTSITHANQVPTSLTMSSTYTSTTLETATLSAYNNNTNYQIVSILGAIPRAPNPILSGTYELNQFVNYSAGGNAPSYLYAKLYFTGLPLNNVLINKTYIGPAGSGNTLNLTTPQILVPANDVSITISKVIFPGVSIGGAEFQFTILTLTLIDQQSNILYTFPTLGGASNSTFDREFFRPEGPITITDTTNITGLRFNLQSSNANCVLNQTVAQNAINARYILEGSIRMLLYDGTSNPTTLAHNSVALYTLSLPLPTSPFVITDYENPNITLEEWFIQTTGSTNNHSVSLRFNDGALSHFDTSIASVSSTPTLSTVMTAGNSVGNTDLNMNGQDITNADVITANTITPTAITGWNVKSLTAGSGITATNNGSGTWTITNTGVPITPTIAQVLTAGSAAGNQNLTGINTLTATTITGWNVKQITGGTDIVVSSDQNGNYVISYDAAGSAYEASNDDYTITAAATNTAQLPLWYGNTFYKRPDMANANTCADIFMSSNGKIIAVVQRDSNDAVVRPILYSTNHSSIFNTGGISKNWISIAGTTMGDAIWAIQGRSAPNNSPYAREIWRSTDQGATWTQRPSPPDFNNADPRRIRVSADGKFQIITDPRTGSLGKIYKSSDYGETWVSQNITNAQSTAFTCAISATGQVQYVKISGTSGGVHANNNNGGIYRSTNYGATWAYINNTDPLYYIDCDATGRIVIASTNNGVITSRDYGLTWRSFTIALATAVSVSPNGNIIWVGCINQTSTTELYYSDDFGLSFTLRNQVPASSYVSTSYISIATNNDGTIVAGGGAGYFNVCRQNVNDVTDLAQGTGISISTDSQGTSTISLSRSPTITYFDEILLSLNTNIALPTSMELIRYDYELEFTMENVLGNQPWFYLRFNQDVGLVGWAGTLFFYPGSGGGGTSVAFYTNASVGNQIYFLNSGVIPTTAQMKATYRISAISATRFVVYLVQKQPAICPATDNANALFPVFATQICYNYSSNDPSRWSPTHFKLESITPNAFSGGRCLIKRVTKTSSYV
jgi:hypothetical protein